MCWLRLLNRSNGVCYANSVSVKTALLCFHYDAYLEHCILLVLFQENLAFLKESNLPSSSCLLTVRAVYFSHLYISSYCSGFSFFID